MADNPKVKSSRHVYAGRVFDLRVDEIVLADGVETQREVIRHPGAVAMIAVDDEGKVLLVSQYRHPAGKRLLEIPAGTLDDGEAPQAAVERELQEEVGYRPGRSEEIGAFYVAPGYCDEFIRVYVCRDLEPSKLDGDEDEDIEIERLTPQEALAAIDDGRINDAKSIIGLLRWANRTG